MVDYDPKQHGFQKQIPPGDERERYVCTDCSWVHYENPKIIVGAVCTWEDKFLLCKRGIAPRQGFWTFPAGFMEEGETTEQGAAREVYEEACAEINVDVLLGVYSIAKISQVHMIYRARLASPDIAVGIESQEVGLFTWDEIPWTELAFPTVHLGLKHYDQSKHLTSFTPFTVKPEDLRY